MNERAPGELIFSGQRPAFLAALLHKPGGEYK